MANDTKNLESFKISDTQPTGVARSATASKGEGTMEQPKVSTGFAKIEELLEEEDPQTFVDGMGKSLEKLNVIIEEASNPREKTSAEKAAVAYEKTIDLVEFLFKTKENLQN